MRWLNVPMYKACLLLVTIHKEMRIYAKVEGQDEPEHKAVKEQRDILPAEPQLCQIFRLDFRYIVFAVEVHIYVVIFNDLHNTLRFLPPLFPSTRTDTAAK